MRFHNRLSTSSRSRSVDLVTFENFVSVGTVSTATVAKNRFGAYRNPWTRFSAGRSLGISAIEVGVIVATRHPGPGKQKVWQAGIGS